MLITLEGIDGSGKSSVWQALSEAHPEATFTREPTDSWYGDAVRRSIGAPDADPLAELFLYTADHADHLARTVRPALVVGLPVGFVNAAESKALLLSGDVPFITNVGRKGGSNVAAAVVNALIIKAGVDR